MFLFRRFDLFVARLGDLAARASGKPMFLVVHLLWWSTWVTIPTSLYYYDLGEVGLLTTSQSFGSNGSIGKSIELDKGTITLPNDKGKWSLNTA